MKSVVMLWEACLMEAGLQHHVRIDRDLAYARKRIEQQGMDFLCIHLPAFEKELLQALTWGRVGPGMFPGFRKQSGIPSFLSGFTSHLFDSDGFVRPDVSTEILRSLRQVLLLVGKVEVEVTRERESAALAAYVETDRMLEEIDEDALQVFRLVSRNLLGSYLADVEQALYSRDWHPRFSSGASANRVKYNERFGLRTWTERLQAVLPWWDDLAITPHEILDHGEDFLVLARDDEPPSRVATVPKTMKGPRIIAEEPSWMNYVQGGILELMTTHLRRHRVLHSVFNWEDQEPNRLLARAGSFDGSFATVDLSEASDRVSLELVEALLSSVPFLRRVVLACRSEKAEMPNGEVISLKKFASMGSATCFPIESMVFFVIEAIAWAESVGMDPSHLRVTGLPVMRTYGDDLIVPTGAAQTLIWRLETYGLKVNSSKSYTTGPFRESCGADWFRGSDVSVFRLRHEFPESRSQLENLVSAIEFHNHAYSAGWWLVAAAAEGLISLLFREIPRAPVGVDVTALWSWEGPYSVRHHPDHQRLQYRSFKARGIKPKDPLDGYGALRKFFQPAGEDPREKDHLKRDGRSQFADAKIGWTSAPYFPRRTR